MSAVIAAAGSGERMKGKMLKQFLPIKGKPILAHTIQRFQDCDDVDEVVVVVPKGKAAYCQNEIVDKYGFEKVIRCVEGEKERQGSVYKGLNAVCGEIVCVHDGVRPAVSTKLVSDCLSAARSFGAAIAGVPIRNTVKRVEEGGVVATLNRNELWEVQTPQAFKRELLTRAFEEALRDGFCGTDESSLVERLGVRVHMVMGSYDNIKVTSFEDLKILEVVMDKEP